VSKLTAPPRAPIIIIIMCAQLHINIFKETGVKLNKYRHDGEPKSVETSYEGKVKEPTVQTARTIPNNKPDIIMSDNEKRTCMLIDVAIPGDRNVIKEDEMILKHKFSECGT